MAKTEWPRWIRGLSRAFRGASGRRAPSRTAARALLLERLEDRLVPAFDLTVGVGVTAGVSTSVSGTTTTFTAAATGAFLSTADVEAALTKGNVVVDSGSAGSENGDVVVVADVTSSTGASLTVETGSTATATAAITQTNGVIGVAGLAVVSSGTAALDDVNNVGTLAAQTAGAFSFANGTNPLVVGAAGGVSGLTSSGDVVEVTTGGALTLDQGISAILIGLNAGGAVTQSGGAPLDAAAGLVLQGAGSFDLTNANNSCPFIAASATGDVNYVNGGDLQTGSFNLTGFGSTAGVSSTGGAVTLASVAGGLTVDTGNNVTAAGTVALTGGVVTVSTGASIDSTGGGVAVTASGALSVLGPVTAAGGVLMEGSGAIQLSAAVNGRTALLEGTGQADVFTIDDSGATPLTVEGLGAGDTFDVTPPTTTTVNVIDPSAGVLSIEAAGGPLGTAPGRVTGTVPDSITYQGIQSIQLDDASTIDAAPGPDTADRPTAFTGLNSKERFVQALYLDDLGRAGSKSDLDFWAALFNQQGVSQAQAQIAAGIAHSREGRDVLVKGWYETFLGRAAQGGEENWAVNLLLQGQTEELVLSILLASTEFGTRAQTLTGNSNASQAYVQALYLLLLNRTGGSSEAAAWVNVLPALGRQGVALDFLTGATGREFRTGQFEGYYDALLHRPSDSAGLNGWVFGGLDISTVRIAFETSAEFFAGG